MSRLTAEELQSMYNEVLALTMPETCDIYDLSDNLLYEGVQCAVDDSSTTVGFNESAGAFVYEGVFTVTLPKWIDLDIASGFKLDVLGMVLRSKTLEAPITYQFRQRVRCTFLETGSTSPTVPPYDLLTANDEPITSGGIGLRIQ